MRAKYLLSAISVLSLVLVGNISSVRADDVYVNLSVLDNLEGSVSPNINQGPLFPVISSSTPKSVKKAVASKKKTEKKSQKKKVELPKKSDIAIKIEKKEELPKPEKTISEPEKIPFRTVVTEDKEEKIQAAPSVPVKTETISTVEQPIKEEVPTSNENQKTVAPETPVSDETKAVTMPQADLPNENISTQAATSQPVVENPLQTALEKMVEETSKLPAQTEPVEEKPSLLVKTQESTETSVGEEIYFAEGEDELVPENEAQIDNIINRFENAKENKIAILSYNLDNGEDSFRKKRMSLNRAVAVRSYLLGKGYKNFSIKVVNLDEANGKENSVRIEELK